MTNSLEPNIIDLLKDLRISVDDRNSDSLLNGSLELILHTLECVHALRQLNERIPDDQLELTGGLFVKSQNEFTAAIGRILMFIMSAKANPNLTELLHITVGKILALFPETAANDSYRNGTSLLHHAVSKQFADVRLIEVIHDANPVCAGNPDNEGALPLHRAVVVDGDTSLDVVKFLISVYPAGTSSADLEGYLPLHWAVNTDVPNIPVIEELIDAYPDACNTTCNMGSLPMHWAVDRPDPDMNVIYMLMKSFSKALRKGCSAGFLPIHRCVDRSNPSIACMKALIKKYPKSLEQDNCDGQLPLHRCVDRCDPSLEAVALLIQSYPGALDTPDVEGYVPLHIALDGESPSIPVVKLLLESCLESGSMKTQDGLLPLHYVLNCQEPSEELIELLLHSYPDGAEALAIDLYPEDPAADPLTWTGPWKKRKWTPLTRALELGQPHIVDMIRHAIESIHGDVGDGDRQRPVSTDSRRSKGGTARPRSNNTRPSSHSSSHYNTIDESTPLKTEAIPGTAVKKPPTSTIRGASTNNYVNDQDGGNKGGARMFSPAGESPAPQAVEASAPISSSIPNAVPPKQLFPAVTSSANSVSSRDREVHAVSNESLPRVSPRANQTAHAESANSGIFKQQTESKDQSPEVEEETPAKDNRERRSKSRHRDRSDGDRRRKHRSRSRARDSEAEGEDGEKKHKHHRRHHRHRHRSERDGDEGERRRRKHPHSHDRRPSVSSSGPGQLDQYEHPPTHPDTSTAGIATHTGKEREIEERMRKLEEMEKEVARKEAEAADAARAAYLKEKKAQEALELVQQRERQQQLSVSESKVSQRSEANTQSAKNQDHEDDYPPYFNHAYSDQRANSHKFPPAGNNPNAPKFQPEGKTDENDPESILKSLQEFDTKEETNTSMSHKFPPATTYSLEGGEKDTS